MGGCLGTDVSSKYKAGEASEQGSKAGQTTERASEQQVAVALLTGSMAYSTFVEIHVECKRLKDADLLR